MVKSAKKEMRQQLGIKLGPRVHALVLQWKNPQGEVWQRFLVMEILKLQESKEYFRYVDPALLFQSRQKRFLNFAIRLHLVGFSHMT